MQKRSANTYQKINTLFKRDEKNLIIPDELSDPVFEYLRDCGALFDAEEKIDGTNVRLEVSWEPMPDGLGITMSVAYKGKTDNAQMPPALLDMLKREFPEEKILEALGLKREIPVSEFLGRKWVDESGAPDFSKIPELFTIYGEGYGKGIQGVGGRYCRTDVKFIGFDVKIGQMYLLRENRDAVLTKLGADIVPYIGKMTIAQAVSIVREGFKSFRSEDTDLDAEGLVLRTPIGLRTRTGERIIIKVKTCDFRKLENAKK